MAWIDIIFIAILGIGAIIGAYKGFLQSLVTLCGTLLTLVLAIWLSKPASGLLESWFGLNTALGSALHDTIAGYCQSGALSPLLDPLAKLLLGANYATTYPDLTSAEFITAFANSIGTLLGTIITVIILFVLIKIVLYLLSKLFDVITKNKAISGMDRVLGFVIGAGKGFLLCFIVFSAAYFLNTLIPSIGDWVTDILSVNPVTNEVYKWSCDFLQNQIIPFIMGL